MQEKQRGFAESNALRDLISKGVDPTTPEGQRALIAAAPNSGPALVKTYLEMGGQQRQNQTADAELSAKNITFHRNLLPTVADQTTYNVWRANTIKDVPKLESSIPKEYSPDTVRNLMTSADKMMEEYNLRTRPSVHTFGDTPFSVTGSTATPITVGGAAPAAAAGAPTAAPAGTLDMDRAKASIAKIESGGNYNATGPVTSKGDRAYGKYQVMGANIPSWTKEALGRSMTPSEFLADKDAQEKVFEYQFGKSAAKYGSAADAASVWFTGKPIAKAGNVADVLGTTAPEYVSKFMAAYGGAPGGGPAPSMMTAPQFAIPGSPPGYIQPTNALMATPAPANMLAAPQQTPLSLNPSITGPAPGTPINATKPQPGFRFNAQGGQEPIPGSPESPEGIAAKVTATKTAEAAAAQEAAKTSKKEVGQYLLRTLGGEGGKKIEDLINASTSGIVQNLAAEAKGAFGTATPGKENIATLGHIAKQMTFDLLNGKLGAGISNADRDFIAGMVADIANPNKPANERIKGLRQLKNTVDAWASGKDVEINAPAGNTPTETKPTINGRAKLPAGVTSSGW